MLIFIFFVINMAIKLITMILFLFKLSQYFFNRTIMNIIILSDYIIQFIL